MGITALLKLVEIALPLGVQVFASFKRNADGTTDVQITLKQADAAFDADLAQTAKWRAEHPAVT